MCVVGYVFNTSGHFAPADLQGTTITVTWRRDSFVTQKEEHHVSVREKTFL